MISKLNYQLQPKYFHPLDLILEQCKASGYLETSIAILEPNFIPKIMKTKGRPVFIPLQDRVNMKNKAKAKLFFYLQLYLFAYKNENSKLLLLFRLLKSHLIKAKVRMEPIMYGMTSELENDSTMFQFPGYARWRKQQIFHFSC